MAITDQDRRILRVLQQQGCISNQDLADKAGMSASACWRRVQALKNSAIIRHFTALVDAPKVGLSFHAVVHIQLAQHDSDDVKTFVTEVGRRPEVLDCFATTGEADYYLRVRCRDIETYNDFLENFLFLLPGVANVRTNLVLREIKHETGLDL